MQSSGRGGAGEEAAGGVSSSASPVHLGQWEWKRWHSTGRHPCCHNVIQLYHIIHKKQASKQTGEQASEQASKEASQPATNQARQLDHLRACSHDACGDAQCRLHAALDGAPGRHHHAASIIGGTPGTIQHGILGTWKCKVRVSSVDGMLGVACCYHGVSFLCLWVCGCVGVEAVFVPEATACTQTVHKRTCMNVQTSTRAEACMQIRTYTNATLVI